MAYPAHSTSSLTSFLALREIAALREEARLCRLVAARLSLHEVRAHMIRMAERREARAAALEADGQTRTVRGAESRRPIADVAG
jgi:hypothetical protein